MTIKTDKVIVENGADFTFVCRKIPFAISCLEMYHGDTNLIDLDLVNKMKIPMRNIRVTRMTLLGHDVRAVGRIKQTVQCVVNGQVQGCVHLEGKVVRDLFSLLNVDCLASSKTYERLMGKKPPDLSDEGYNSSGDIPTLGGKEDEEIDKEEKEETKDSFAKDDQKTEDPPDPPDSKSPGNNHPIPSLQIIKSDNPNLCIVEVESAKSNVGCNASAHSNVYEHFEKFGPGPRDLLEFQLNSISMKDEEHDEEETEFHCDLCFHEGKPLKIVTNHDNRCPTCPSMTPAQKVRMFGVQWKDQAKTIIETRYRREKERRR